jgi:hypothetical protein
MASWLNRKSNFLTRTILTCIGIIFLLPAFSIAAQLSLAWDSNAPPVDGYLLFMRADNNAYDYLSPVWSGTETTCTMDDLSDGTYYFVVHAYCESAESVDSNEVKVIIADSIDNSSGADCDVDGLDLVAFLEGGAASGLDVFAATFGSVTCP